MKPSSSPHPHTWGDCSAGEDGGISCRCEGMSVTASYSNNVSFLQWVLSFLETEPQM